MPGPVQSGREESYMGINEEAGAAERGPEPFEDMPHGPVEAAAFFQA
jgi:hypothetical protein